MLTLAQTKTLDALEYALALIEQYDQEFQKRATKDHKDEKKKEDQGKSGDVSIRYNDVKYNYQQLFTLNRDRAVDFIKNSGVYRFADERIHLNEKFERSCEMTNNFYNSLNTQIYVPIHDKIVLIYDTSLKKASVVIENIQNGNLLQMLGERVDTAKVTLTKNWMKLDLNNDGRVTVADLLNAIINIRLIIAQSRLAERAWKLKDTMKRKAICYLAGAQEKHVNKREEAPLVNVGGDTNADSSIEMQNLQEKDD